MYPQAIPNQIQSLMENPKQNSVLKTWIIISKGTLFGLVTLLSVCASYGLDSSRNKRRLCDDYQTRMLYNWWRRWRAVQKEQVLVHLKEAPIGEDGTGGNGQTGITGGAGGTGGESGEAGAGDEPSGGDGGRGG